MRVCVILVAVSFCIAVSGCSKKDGDAGSKAGPAKADKVKADKVKDSGPFAGFNMDKIKQKWKGAWVVGGSSLGTKEAWEVEGSKVTVYNGKSEEVYDFKLQAPCVAYVSQTKNGATSGTYSKFAFDGDTLYSGLGDVGVKNGSDIVACVSGDIYTLKAGKCTKWTADMFDRSKMKPSDAQCSLTGEVFKVKQSPSYESELKVKGNVLLNQQMQGNLAVKASDLAEAKTKLK